MFCCGIWETLSHFLWPAKSPNSISSVVRSPYLASNCSRSTSAARARCPFASPERHRSSRRMWRFSSSLSRNPVSYRVHAAEIDWEGLVVGVRESLAAHHPLLRPRDRRRRPGPRERDAGATPNSRGTPATTRFRTTRESVPAATSRSSPRAARTRPAAAAGGALPPARGLGPTGSAPRHPKEEARFFQFKEKRARSGRSSG